MNRCNYSRGHPAGRATCKHVTGFARRSHEWASNDKKTSSPVYTSSMKPYLLLKHNFLSYATAPQQLNACWGDFPREVPPTKREILDRAQWVRYKRVRFQCCHLGHPHRWSTAPSKCHFAWLWCLVTSQCPSARLQSCWGKPWKRTPFRPFLRKTQTFHIHIRCIRCIHFKTCGQQGAVSNNLLSYLSTRNAAQKVKTTHWRSTSWLL